MRIVNFTSCFSMIKASLYSFQVLNKKMVSLAPEHPLFNLKGSNILYQKVAKIRKMDYIQAVVSIELY